AVTKTFTDNSVDAGTSGHTFTISVKNNGPSDAVGVNLTDPVDGRLHVTGVSESGATQPCAASALQTVDCTFDLANGATKTITVTYSVAANVAPATVSNTATATASGQPIDATGSDTVDITRSVSLAVTKTFTDNSVDAGTSGHTFTISVKNNGPSDAVGVNLTDPVDGRLHVTGVSESGATQPCAASALQTVDCTFDLANGATKTITVTYSVAANVAPATVSNTATATASGLPIDATGSDTVDITRSVSLAVTKTFTDNSVDAGTSGHTFTISVKNNGPSDAVGVNLTDPVDGRLHVTGVSESGATQPCAASALQTVDCTFDLANGATKTITVTYSVAANVAPATVSNTATAAASGQPIDATGSDTVDITRSVSLAVTKTFTDNSVDAGTSGHTFTISVK